MINECHIKYVFDPLMGVIMIFVGDGVQDFFFPCFFIYFWDDFLCQFLFWSYYVCSCGIDDFDLFGIFPNFMF